MNELADVNTQTQSCVSVGMFRYCDVLHSWSSLSVEGF